MTGSNDRPHRTDEVVVGGHLGDGIALGRDAGATAASIVKLTFWVTPCSSS